MLSALVCLAVHQSAFDFSCKATSLRQALELIGEQQRAKLEANGPVADQVVFIDVHGVSLKDLKEKIATAVAGTWERKDDREIIQRLPKQSDAIIAEYRAKRKKLLAAEQEKFKKSIEKPFNAKELFQGLANLGNEPGPTEDRAKATQYWQKQKNLFDAGPMARLIRRLFLAAKLDDLALVGPYGRLIFTATPTRLQKAFDRAKYNDALAHYRKEQNAWLDAARGYDFGEDPRGRMVSDPRTQLKQDPNATEFNFTYSRGDMTGLGMVNLQGARDERTGRRDILAQLNLEGPEREFLNASMNPESVPASDPPIRLSEDSKALQTAFASIFTQRKNAPLTAAISELILNPETHDPLSFLVSDTLHDYAESKKANVVACLGDSLYMWATFAAMQRAPRVGLVMETFRRTGALSIDEADGWMVMTPGFRYEDELTFTPRKPLGDLLRATAKRGAMDMVDFSTFAFRSNRVSRRGLETYYLGVLNSSTMSLMDRNDWNAFRLYGGLSPEQRKVLEADGSVPTQSMSPALKAIVERMVYSSEIRSETTSPNGVSMTSGAPVEPTEAYQNGLPAGAELVGKASSSPVIVAYGRGGDGKPKGLRYVEPYTLASIETDVIGKPELMKSYGVPDLLGYAMGKQKSIRMRLMLEPKVWRESMIVLDDFDNTATPVAWDKLPEAQVGQIRAAFDQLKQQKELEKKGTPPPSR